MTLPCRIVFGCRYLARGGEREGGHVGLATPFPPLPRGGEREGGHVSFYTPFPPWSRGGEREGGHVGMTGPPPERYLAGTYSEQTPGDVTILVPAGVEADDILIGFVVNPFGGDVITGPFGWTVLNAGPTAGGAQYWVGWRLATSEPPSYTWGTGMGGSGSGGMAAIRDATLPGDYTINDGYGDTMTALSAVSIDPLTVAVVFFSRMFALGDASVPAGLTLLAPADLSHEGQLYAEDGVPVGPSGNYDSHVPFFIDWVAFTVMVPSL